MKIMITLGAISLFIAAVALAQDTGNARAKRQVTLHEEMGPAADIMAKWDTDTNAVKSLEGLRRVAIEDGALLESARPHLKKAAELWSGDTSPTSLVCRQSVYTMLDLMNEYLTVQIDKKNLLLNSDLSTPEGFKKLRHDLLLITARENATINKRNAFLATDSCK